MLRILPESRVPGLFSHEKDLQLVKNTRFSYFNVNNTRQSYEKSMQIGKKTREISISVKNARDIGWDT
jgi:hypothetical protein